MAALSNIVVVAVLLSLVLHIQALDASYFVSNNATCMLTGLLPSEPPGADFCSQFTSKSCCLPSYDLNTIQPNYLAIVPQGPGCGATKHSIRASYSAFRSLVCLPCDPKEPQYRFLSAMGDTASGGLVPADPNAGATDFTWRICKSFFYGRGRGTLKRGMWGTNASHLDKCGLNVQTCRQTSYFDPVALTWTRPNPNCTGSAADLIVPSVAYSGVTDPAVDLTSYLPVNIPNFQFVVVDDEDQAFSFAATPCFGSDVSAAPALQSIFIAILTLAVSAALSASL